jgi:hypothetical protein
MVVCANDLQSLERTAGTVLSSMIRTANNLRASAALYEDGLTTLRRTRLEEGLNKLTLKVKWVTEIYGAMSRSPWTAWPPPD